LPLHNPIAPLRHQNQLTPTSEDGAPGVEWIEVAKKVRIVSSEDMRELGMERADTGYSMSTDVHVPPEAAAKTVRHVFLSHNGQDKPAVKELGLMLKQRGLNVWLDEWELRPGVTWQNALEDIIATCEAAAVCIGENGVGPWVDPEMMALLRRFVDEKRSGNVLPVIPVILPGAPAELVLPVFLQAFTWVDLRDGITPAGIEKLVWGITGVKPSP
jgi:hypothetical protein